MTENTGIFILGEQWTIKEDSVKNNPMLSEVDGYTDPSIKLIVINDFKDEPQEALKADIDQYRREVLRHEILHAFLYESGLDHNTHTADNWAADEEIVDWFAIQAPKIMKTFIEADAI